MPHYMISSQAFKPLYSYLFADELSAEDIDRFEELSMEFVLKVLAVRGVASDVTPYMVSPIEICPKAHAH